MLYTRQKCPDVVTIVILNCVVVVAAVAVAVAVAFAFAVAVPVLVPVPVILVGKTVVPFVVVTLCASQQCLDHVTVVV